MDIFTTVVTGGQILYSFISACAEFSSDAKSLAARFAWDMRIIEQFMEFFKDRQTTNKGKLSESDQVLLDSSISYLSSLVESIAAKRSKLETKGWHREWNRLRWIRNKGDLVDLEHELFEWTSRFDLRLVSLPKSLRTIIKLDERGAKHAPRLASQMRIDEYYASSEEVGQKLAATMKISNPESDLSFFPTAPARRRIASQKQGKVIVEYKPHANWLLQDQQKLEEAKQAIRSLSCALSFVDPTVTGLLKCTGYFHEESTDNPRFGLVFQAPFSLAPKNPKSLKDILNEKDDKGNRLTAMHSLEQRIVLARRIASAVYFLHAIGWDHKSIRSDNILMLEAESLPVQDTFPRALGHPYLVNFESARADTATTDFSLAQNEDRWHLNVYRHPKRQGANMSVRFTMAHDAYSLGVVLLEIGLWRPYEKYEKTLKGKDPFAVRDELVDMATSAAIQMGSKYRDLVVWCLRIEDEKLETLEYTKEIIEKLEEFVM